MAGVAWEMGRSSIEQSLKLEFGPTEATPGAAVLIYTCRIRVGWSDTALTS
jgi:hypothetical protein